MKIPKKVKTKEYKYFYILLTLRMIRFLCANNVIKTDKLFNIR